MNRLIGELPTDALAFERQERAVRQQVLSVAAGMLAASLNADHSDYLGPGQPCPCGKTARFAGRRPRQLLTVLGPITLSRAYYHCAACEQGFFPRDRLLGVEDSAMSPGVQRMTGVVGSAVSFAEGADLLHELAGLAVSARQVERYAERVGNDAARYEETVSCAPTVAPTEVMYLGQDGTGVPMRPPALQGRPGKQADGSARTREMKVCTVWTADARDAHGTPTRDPGSVRYTAAIETAETHSSARQLAPFAQRVEREARRSGFTLAKRQVALGDGAAWLWNIVDECFPNAIQILDKFHAKEHIHEAGRAIFGPASDLAADWVQARCAELDEGKIEALIEAIQAQSTRSQIAAQCAGYFRNNRHRMDYPRYEAEGLCVGSGVVEAACKTAIGARLKRAGMRWSLPGANAIAALRCCRLSGRYDQFWSWRAKHRARTRTSMDEPNRAAAA